jgi:hypothetical protein
MQQGSFMPNSMDLLLQANPSLLRDVEDRHKDEELRSAERIKLGLPAERKLIVNISQPNRLTAIFFDAIIEILHRCPNTGLVLVEHNPVFRKRIEARFSKAGLDSRLHFLQYAPVGDGELHRRLALIDLALDINLNFNAHTAGVDMLWAVGVMVVVTGETIAGRIGASLSNAFGTPENVCQDPKQAVELVCRIVSNAADLEARQLNGHPMITSVAHQACLITPKPWPNNTQTASYKHIFTAWSMSRERKGTVRTKSALSCQMTK